jgi:hypothetical protein
LLITVDPSDRVPTAAAFMTESQAWLVKQKGRVLKSYSARRMRPTPPLDAFALEVEMNKQKFWMDYYVTAQWGGGATLAARLQTDGLSTLRKEVEQIARSVVITRKIVVLPKR